MSKRAPDSKGNTMKKVQAIVPETADSEVPTTGNGKTPIDPIARAEKILAAQAAWRAKNRDKVEGYQKKWRTANKAKVVAAHKRYQEKNPEKVAAWHKKSQAKQREIVKQARAIIAANQAEEAAKQA
jgi:hypothetical protein